jgi:phage baseplate assembly protein W
MATTNGKDYIDFDMDFTAHPTTGDLVQVKKNNVINRSIQNILKTAWYERLMQPDISGGVGGLLFENFGPLTDSRLAKAIKNSIQKFEPRAIVKKVKVIRKEEQNAYQIYIEYLPDNSTQTESTETYLERTG